MSTIEIKNLTKRYGEAEVLSNINMKLESGKIYGLVGRNLSLIHILGVVSAVCISFVLFSIVLLPIMPLVGGDGMTQYFGYFACAMNFAGPLAYSILVGFLFGLFAVSVTSFGILAVSIFPNRYVGIAASFVAFYVIYAFAGSFPFSVLSLIHIWV